MKKNNKKYISLAVILGVLILLNLLASSFYKRLDLTENKRYTLSDTSKEILINVEEPLVVDVFLKGEFPSEFKRLQNETRYLLEEYEAFNPNVKFNFINPLEENREAQAIATDFYKAGMTPENLNVNENGKVTESLLFPWAVANLQDRRVKIHLLKKKIGDRNEDIVNSSVQQLEYAFSDGFNKLINERSKKVAIMRGNGELADAHIADFVKSIRDYYYIAPFTLDSVANNPQKTLQQLKEYDLIIEAKPTEAYTEKEKLVLDQYIMSGGKSLWLLENVSAEKDSLFTNNENKLLAFYNDLNLTDLFFKYGARVNPEIVNDVYSAPIVLAKGTGKETQFNPYPWFYDPMAVSKNNHPITHNIEAVKFNFANPIDTLKNNIHKTILLQSSKSSKLEGVPIQINLQEVIQKKPDPASYNAGPQNLAVLLEGKFTSVYKNRVLPFPAENYKENSSANKMLIISDGDVIKNTTKKGKPQALGYDPMTATTYGNKEFLVNAVNYLLDDKGLLKIRSKEVKLAFLNTNRIAAERLQWQLINIIVPLLFLGIFGLIFSFYRKRKYVN
ncbi:gliding motility-associated ABC transporter substrate-binding protein GldG [Mesonia aestuariivivens]|uniref:Gliding motility-associated ABC transporter substrate-binding protein GldG n=1 Tax=Mesonia aestuariivivens TaxID=2796128 RepID=A0ABS6W0J9_9FLAO|nr:gliding motility-associated ABC transporter substrate-binding protein GldG [Mesonia aestuariivivens]MBW2961082.1 gliding motility-associated ABC transporter substrate-binding protein GldG [Mesonia aestuariivivens]